MILLPMVFLSFFEGDYYTDKVSEKLASVEPTIFQVSNRISWIK